MSIDLITATHSDFEPFTGERFTIGFEEGPIALTLSQVKVHTALAPRDNHVEIDGVVLPPRQPFTLTFTGPAAPLLHQGTYEISHPKAGPLTLFLSPFAQDAKETLYETVFN